MTPVAIGHLLALTPGFKLPSSGPKRDVRSPFSVLALVVLIIACAATASAQGKSKDHKKGSPPSHSVLPPPTAVGRPMSTVPFAWIDDADVLPAGSAWIGVSVLDWRGSDSTSEVDVPVMDIAAGLSRRVELVATIPHVVGSDASGVSGGLGTSLVSAKIALLDPGTSSVELAVAPAIEILGSGVLQTAVPGEGRVRWGLPASVQVAAGNARLYASAGYFKGGIWFASGGAGLQATAQVAISVSFSRSWVRTSATDSTAIEADRTELSGGAAYTLTSWCSLFGSLGHTIGTTAENGAGTSLSAGIGFLLPGHGK
jgi:hypothetical protein